MRYDLLDIDSLLLSDKEAIRYLLISPQHYYDLGRIVDLIQHDFIGICAMYPYLFMSMHLLAPAPQDPLASYHKINHVLFAKLSDKYYPKI